MIVITTPIKTTQLRRSLPRPQQQLALPLGQWSHVVVTRAGSTISWYVNGVLDSSFTASVAPSASSLPLLIGADWGLTPAAVIGQRFSDGRWVIVDELTMIDTGIARFADLLVAHVAQHYPGFQCEGHGDPAGMAEHFSGLLWGTLMTSLLLRVADRPSPREIARRARDAAAALLRLYPPPDKAGRA